MAEISLVVTLVSRSVLVRSTSTSHTQVQLVDMLSTSGMPVVEATAFVNKKKVPMMADAEEVYRSIRKEPGVAYPVLTPTLGQLERALDCGVREVAVFTAASETFTARNIGCTIDESFARF